MSSRQASLLIATLALASGCGGASAGDEATGYVHPQFGAPLHVIVHPQRERLLSSSRGAPVVPVRSTPPDRSVQPLLQALGGFDASRALGAADGAPERTLGRIVAGGFLSDGRLALVDRDHASLRLVDRQLEPVGMIGGAGDGPGELRRPVDLAEDGAGRLLVLNVAGGQARLERFRRDGDGFAFDRRLPLRLLAASSICVLGHRVFINGVSIRPDSDAATGDGEPLPASPAFVHEIDGDGRIVRSFSAPYPAPFERRRELAGRPLDDATHASLAMDLDVLMHFANARMACDAGEGGRVWIAYTELGEVHLHGADGELRWIARIDDFDALALHQSTYAHGPAVGGDPTRGLPMTTDRVSDVTLLADDVLAVQVARTTMQPDRSRTTTWRTWLLGARTGRALGSFDADHRVLASRAGQALLYREALHPQVVVVPVR
jgi:hypothetical protein